MILPLRTHTPPQELLSRVPITIPAAKRGIATQSTRRFPPLACKEWGFAHKKFGAFRKQPQIRLLPGLPSARTREDCGFSFCVEFYLARLNLGWEAHNPRNREDTRALRRTEGT